MTMVKEAQKRAGLIAVGGTRRRVQNDTGLAAEAVTDLIPSVGTRRAYSPRARKCKCGCGKVVKPTAQAPHKVFFDDICRKRWHRQQDAKRRGSRRPAPALAAYTCEFCGGSFLAVEGKGAKYCKPSHTVQAAHCRRMAAERVLIEYYSMSAEAARDLVESSGMRNVSATLRNFGYVYDEYARLWTVGDARE